MVNKGDIPKFNPQVYTKIALTDLVIYSIHFLHQQGDQLTSEDIVSACFQLFPKRFALRKYPHWPDSAVVIRRWSDCRNKGYLVGNTAKGFKLTAKGYKFAEKVGNTLGGQRPVRSSVPAEVKTRAGRFVRSIETSDAFVHYKKNGKNARISEFDFRSMLLCTMESSAETLKRNLEQFKEYANVYNRHDLSVFLNFCDERFSYLLEIPRKHRARKMQKSRRKL